MHSRTRRALVGAGVVTTLAVTSVSAFVAPQVLAATPSVTLTVNPWYAGGSFSGWGTTLGQWANATAAFPDETREEVHRLLFSDEGLGLTAARYVIGAGDASDAPDDLAHGAALDGWWTPDADGTAGTYGGVATTMANRTQIAAAFDPAQHLDRSADAAQRWWVDRVRDDVTYWETSARSAPYFMTVSGRVSGNGGWSNQLSPAETAAYAEYLLAVTAELEDAHDVDMRAVSPFYEPNTPQWNAGGPLEGMRVEAWYGEDVIEALHAGIGDGDLLISGPDDTSPYEGRRDWTEWQPATRDLVDIYSTHSDATTDSRYFADIAASHDASLAMTGFVPGTALSADMAGGLDLATRLSQDLRDLEPERWILDQAVVDTTAPAGQTGVLGLALDDTTSQVRVGSGYAALRNFTAFIEPGSRFVGVNDAGSTAALDADGEGVSIVHPNTTAGARTVVLDLTGFATTAGATVTPYVTSADGTTVAGQPVAVAEGRASIDVPARSVTTFEVAGASGVSDTAVQVGDGDERLLQGVHSGKPLTLGAAGRPATVYGFAGTTARAAQQLLTFHEVEVADRLSRRAFVITDAAGRVLGSGPDLRDISVEDAAADRSAVWFLRSIDGGVTFNLANAATAQALDVASWATADGSNVVPYFNNAASNQQWRLQDAAPRETAEVAVRTATGVRPALPTRTSAVYAWGGRLTVRDVVWSEPELDVWDAPGTVEVTGTGTDVWGNAVSTTAVVVVGEVTGADDAAMRTFAGATPALVAAEAPRTVAGRIQGSDRTFAVPVEWDFSGVTAGDLAGPGTLTVPSVEGAVDAELTIEVVAAETVNVLRTATVRASATFSEPGYEPDDNNADLNDGNRTNKGWSNWFGGGYNPSDRIAFYFDRPQLIDSFTAYDGPEGNIVDIRFQYRDLRGAWLDVPTSTPQPIAVGGQRFTTTVAFTPVVATAARVVVRSAGGHMTLSELEVSGLRAAG